MNIEQKLEKTTRAYLISEVVRLREEVATNRGQITILQATIADLRKSRAPLLALADSYHAVSQHMVETSKKMAYVAEFVARSGDSFCEDNMRSTKPDPA